jgi:HD superfamily phosphodiesterase
MPNKTEMEEFVVSLLNDKLPAWYYYHNCEHTLYVMEKAVEIAQQENCTEQEIDLVRTAALWHDVGCINKFKGHEEESCLFAQKYIPGYGYSDEAIDTICGMIRATKIPQTPHNKLEQIVADADLEYLGTDTVDTKAELLYKELQSQTPHLTRHEWDRVQISFIQKHHYFTRFCQQNREPAKSKYLDKLVKSFH